MHWRRVLILAWPLLVGCAGYTDNELELITAARAKDFCSCLFVGGLLSASCEVETARVPPIATVSVDLAARAVEAQSRLMWSARAQLVDERAGCALE